MFVGSALLLIFTLSEQGKVRSLRDVQTARLISGLGSSLFVAALSDKTVAAAETSTPGFDSIESTALFIKKYCPTIYKAVQESGKPLYRGENVVKDKAILLQSESDLNNPKTYGSFAAADFFSSFQNFTLGILDSGHIGTSDMAAASNWGGVCSIWPLDTPGNALTYAWLRNDVSFWDEDWNAPQSVGLKELGGPFFWRSSELMNSFLTTKNNLNLNKGLSTALSAGHEVIFANNGAKIAAAFADKKGAVASSSPKSSLYVAVPLLVESKLLTALDITPFSPSIDAVKVRPDPETYIDNDVSSGAVRDVKKSYRTGMGKSGGGVTARQYRNQYPSDL